MTLRQHLARIAIYRWTRDRQVLRCGKISAPLDRPGRQSHAAKTSVWDARIVRVLDFERILAGLDTEQQAVLLAVYREGLSDTVAAEFIGCSPRKVAYLKPLALEALASALDREDLL